MSYTTEHGDNIANEIQSADAYGDYNELSDADVWLILDNLHTHMVDTRGRGDLIFSILEKAMHDLEAIDEDLPVW